MIEIPSHLKSLCGESRDTGFRCPWVEFRCLEAVKQEPRSGRWFITMGHAGFNSAANNARGYRSARAARAVVANLANGRPVDSRTLAARGRVEQWSGDDPAAAQGYIDAARDHAELEQAEAKPSARDRFEAMLSGLASGTARAELQGAFDAVRAEERALERARVARYIDEVWQPLAGDARSLLVTISDVIRSDA